MSQVARLAFAKRIYNHYLKTGAPFLAEWPDELNNAGLMEAIATIRANVESPDAILYDDICHLATTAIKCLFTGFYSADYGETLSFRKSIFFSSMRNDLRGATFIADTHIQRAIERLADAISTCNIENIWDKISPHIEVLYQSIITLTSTTPITALRTRPPLIIREKATSSSVRDVSADEHGKPSIVIFLIVGSLECIY